MLFAEHAATYFIEVFRRYDIEQNGVMDINGVPRAKTESLLSTVQYFVICFLIGYIIKELIAVDRSHIPIREHFCLLWLIVDGAMMLMSRVYNSFALYLKIDGELTRNMFTLYYCQRTMLFQEKIYEQIRADLFAKLFKLKKPAMFGKLTVKKEETEPTQE